MTKGERGGQSGPHLAAANALPCQYGAFIARAWEGRYDEDGRGGAGFAFEAQCQGGTSRAASSFPRDGYIQDTGPSCGVATPVKVKAGSDLPLRATLREALQRTRDGDPIEDSRANAILKAVLDQRPPKWPIGTRTKDSVGVLVTKALHRIAAGSKVSAQARTILKKGLLTTTHGEMKEAFIVGYDILKQKTALRVEGGEIVQQRLHEVSNVSMKV